MELPVALEISRRRDLVKANEITSTLSTRGNPYCEQKEDNYLNARRMKAGSREEQIGSDSQTPNTCIGRIIV